MFLESPNYYSTAFCKAEMIIFLLFCFFYLRHKVKRLYILNFDTIFLFSFFCINYIHPCFIYPDDSFLPAFAFPYNTHNISYGVALASIGISSYMLGNICFESKIKHKFRFCPSQRTTLLTEKVSLIISILLFLYVFFILTINYGITHFYPRLMILIVAVISLSFYYKSILLKSENRIFSNNWKGNIKLQKYNIISLLLFSISLLFLGSRGNVIALILFILGIFNCFYKKIKIQFLIPTMICSMLFMSILTLTRTTSINLTNSSFWQVMSIGYERIFENSNAIWLILLDLVVNARTLYEAVDYTKEFGYLYGASFLPYLLCFIPGGGIFITKLLLGKSTMDVNTGMILTNYANAPYGIGTNMIGDLYMNFSLFGVIIFPLLLGVLIAICESCNNKYKSICYFSLLANSIYIPRASILCWIDLFVIIVILDFTLRYINKINLIK